MAERPDMAGPVRMCVICRRRLPKNLVERYALGPDGRLTHDERKRMPGRGWNLCADPRCKAKFAAFRPKRKGRRKGGARAEDC